LSCWPLPIRVCMCPYLAVLIEVLGAVYC